MVDVNPLAGQQYRLSTHRPGWIQHLQFTFDGLQQSRDFVTNDR
jgi:hypothetical protein